MRFHIKKTQMTRHKTRFLFLPKRIGNEVRWLEKATVEQHRNGIEGFWENIKFIDIKTKE